MTSVHQDRDTEPPAGTAHRRRWRPGSLEILGLVLLLALLLRDPLQRWSKVLPSGWSTVFVAICVQATPFLVLGVLVSGVIAAFVPARFFTAVLPRRAALAVPVAGVCGIALPGCECGSVPIADRLMDRGVRPSAALAFLLSAPAINPVVLVATAVAFTAEPRMVWARLVAGLATAVVVGGVWERLGRPEWLRPRVRRPVGDAQGWPAFVDAVRGDFTQAAGFLVIGAAAAATLQTVVPRAFMEHVGGSVVLSILAMAVLAFVLALCSESDAFVAASFATIPVVGKLVFLTVGPAVDVKLVAMQSGTFGRRFAVRFAPLTFVVAVVVGTVTGLLFFGGWR
ncbi:permease [Nakamurella endophytica]|uniref:Permease n=1 Tax=Nakamurella endophytica TaxID=1748367 RepID=A0A917WIG9_9ACTN|nr:permease [Nakamurella endophytica]GGM06663.1 permease [Nakamurella endophytica]